MDDAKEQHVYGKFCVKLKKSFENNAISWWWSVQLHNIQKVFNIYKSPHNCWGWQTVWPFIKIQEWCICHLYISFGFVMHNLSVHEPGNAVSISNGSWQGGQGPFWAAETLMMMMMMGHGNSSWSVICLCLKCRGNLFHIYYWIIKSSIKWPCVSILYHRKIKLPFVIGDEFWIYICDQETTHHLSYWKSSG
jgi:hypothetical protein